MHIARADHLVLTVIDIDRTLNWYTRVLGMEPVTFGDGRRALAFGQQKFNLHQTSAELAPHAAQPTPGSADLCLISAVSLPAAHDHLAAHGVAFEQGPVARTGATGPITSVYIRDPDGNLIEISTYDSGRPQAPNPYDLLPPVPAFTLTSTDVRDDQPLPMAHVHASCGGRDRSPHLAWADAPPDTRSYAVTCYDPDAPTGSGFWHWLLLGLPVDTSELASDAGHSDDQNLPSGAFHLRNDFGAFSYSGAAPPLGDPAHRYLFAVHALDSDDLGLDSSATTGYAGFTLVAHTLARAVLTPTYCNAPNHRS